MILLLDVVAAGSLAVCAWLVQPTRSVPLSRIATPQPPQRDSAAGTFVAIGILAASIWAVVGGVFGLVSAIAVAWGVRRWLLTIPNATRVANERRRAAELPVAVDLLAACLTAGATPTRALQVVGPCVESSLRGDLRVVAAAMEVGGIPDEAWARFAHGDLSAVSAIMRRTAVTGAPASDRLSALALELRARLRTRALADARALGVRSAGPLGVCFLPAFILIGVVPLVASLVQQWL